MKMTRKLIPTFVMLIVSAIMLSTASFAWFATRTTVTATDMTVKAKADTKYLTIANALDGEYGSTAAATTTSAEVDLVHAEIADIGKENIEWYLGSSTDVNNAGNTNADPMVDPVITDYALVNTFWFKMSDTSNANLKQLNVSAITVTNYTEDDLMNPALRVLVVGPDGSQIWKFNAGTELVKETNLGDYLISDEIDNLKNDANQVTVYMYYDGEVATSNMATTLNSMTVSITFSAVDA